MTGSPKSYDVVIVGGGPAGSSAAIHLASRGARVLLAEQERFPRSKLCGEFISPECLPHFERLGVASKMMEAGGARLIETVFYSRKGARLRVPSEWFGAGGAALGLSRAEMDARLLQGARDAGAETLEEARAVGPLLSGKRVRGVRLKTADGELDVESTITVDATGRSRYLSRRIMTTDDERAPLKQKRARLVAFKAHLEGATGEAGRCEIYFYRGGYGGLSSVENGLSNLCFIAAARDVRACGGDALRAMREIVSTNRRAAETLARARVQSPWLAVSLDGFGRRMLAPAAGLLAAGDAASFIDPFTGSGMLMALESGELVAEVIHRHLPRCRSSEDEPEAFHLLAADYRSRYGERFDSRLRLCSWLRRAAFVPGLAEAGILLFGASRRARYRLARATRRRATEKQL